MNAEDAVRQALDALRRPLDDMHRAWAAVCGVGDTLVGLGPTAGSPGLPHPRAHRVFQCPRYPSRFCLRFVWRSKGQTKADK